MREAEKKYLKLLKSLNEETETEVEENVTTETETKKEAQDY